MSNTRNARRRRGNAQAGTNNGSSLRSRLLTRPRPFAVYPLLVDDPTEARERLALQQQELRQARLRHDPDAYEAARQRVADLEQAGDSDDVALQLATRDLAEQEKRGKALAEAQNRIEAAEAAIEACYAKVKLRAMPPNDYEALLARHPPTPEQVQAAISAGSEPPLTNDDTFRPALVAACAVGDMTVEDWAAFLNPGDGDEVGASAGETNELWAIVIALNERARFADPTVLPFVSTVTRS